MKNNGGATVTLSLALGLIALVPALAADDGRKEYGALFGVLEPPNPADIAAAPTMLGRALFWDTRASANSQIACASCRAVADWPSRPASGPLSLRHVYGHHRLTGRLPAPSGEALGNVLFSGLQGHLLIRCPAVPRTADG